MNYGVVLLSTKLMGDDGTCSFDFFILLFVSSSELFVNAVTRMYIDKIKWSDILILMFLVPGILTGILPLDVALVWLLLTSSAARGTAYVASSLAWVIR